MAKFCVFCGSPPTSKNKEHVVPLWLIKLTGDPNRKAWFGIDMSSLGENQKKREYAFDQFTFPACESCNNKYSDMETKAQRIVENVLNSKPLLPGEISTFLDWLDKVRIGLWLGFQQLDKNHLNVEPQFHIEHRIGQYDRLLVVEKTDFGKQRLNFGGINTPAFGYTPSAFCLTVNQYCFTNVSFNYLFARRIGFPYPDAMKLQPNRPEIACNILPARQRIMLPLLKRRIAEHGNIFYQPMFKQGLSSNKIDEYNDEYVVEHSLDHGQGIGSIYAEVEGESGRWLHADEKIELSSKTLQNGYVQHIKAVMNICEWQNWLSEGSLSLDALTSEQKKYVKAVQRMCKGINDMLIAHHRETLNSFYPPTSKVK